jgi:hypothetical protein
MLKMADLGSRAMYGSSWKILENRFEVQDYVILFPM